jgi:hypothetical protein
MTTLLAVIVLALVGVLTFELYERREERLDRLNRESWEALQAARRIQDETDAALRAMLDAARLHGRTAERSGEIER